MPSHVPLLPRLARLVRKRSPRAIAETLHRATKRELACRRIELMLAASPRPLIVGPFLGEVGFELLYWIPMLRRLLERRGVPPERVTVLTRGGAGAWYRGLARGEIEILDLLPEGDLSSRLAERRERAGDAKQLTIERLDRELIARALDRTGPATVVHPILMFTRLRWTWQGARPVSDVLRYGDYRPLPPPTAAPSEALSAELPAEYVAIKPYFSDCFPATEENRTFLRELVRSVAAATPVVVLSAGHALDDHEEWRPGGVGRVVDTSDLIRARDNLAMQSRLVAGARALLSTYGGFSYLGPFFGVPTLAFRSNTSFNRTHLDVLREALPNADYGVADVREADRFRAFGHRCVETVGARPT